MDVARAIDLERAESALPPTRRTTFQHKSRIPTGGAVSPPLRMGWRAPAVGVAGFDAREELEISIYDLGALCVTWTFPFQASPEELVGLSVALYGHAELRAHSREIAAGVVDALGACVDGRRTSLPIEDYAIFQVEPSGPVALPIPSDHRPFLARILRAEEGLLSPQEVEDATHLPISYGLKDICLVDWLAAFLAGRDTEDERLVLELATVELQQLRLLDLQLEREIQDAYDLLARRRGLWGIFSVQRRELERVGRMQADGALLYEGMDNPMKLVGDDFLARLYRAAAERFHFRELDISIQRKLGVLFNVYQSMADLGTNRRSEALEWIIILLIVMDIVLVFLPLR
jgi:hypothetical protein